MDVVYPLKRRMPNGGAELRFSLRSVAANVPHDKLWIVSMERPRWLSGDVQWIRVNERNPNKWRNLPVALLAATAQEGMSDTFLLMNDDFFVMERVESVPVMHRGPIEDWGGWNRPTSAWARGFHETVALLEKWHQPAPFLNYEVHAPLPVDRAKLRLTLAAALEEFKGRCLQTRMLYGNCWKIGGEFVKDFKVRSRGDINRAYLSTSDGSFDRYEVGKRIREAFPRKCRYEK